MATNLDVLQLLSAVVPAFLTLATFYISDNSDALAARAKLGPREPYFAKVYDELQVLDETLRGWNQTSLPPNSVLKHMLDLFECLSSGNHGTNNNDFAKLLYLRQQLHTAQEHGKALDTDKIKRLIRLEEKRPERRKHIIDRIKSCNNKLQACIRASRRRHPTGNMQPADPRNPTSPRLVFPSMRVRDHSNILYLLLKSHWECKGHEPHRSVRLRLAMYRNEENETRLNMLLCSENGPPLRWQQSQARILQSKREPVSRAEKSKSKPPKKVSCLDHPRNPELQHLEPSQKQASPIKQNFCELVRRTADNGILRLNLLVEDGKLLFSEATPVTDMDHSQTFTSLSDILKEQSQSPQARIVTLKDRMIVTVILANAFLHFCEGPWCTQEWSKVNIYFPMHENSVRPNFARPYLTTNCIFRDEQPEERANDDIAASLTHSYPCIVALGILLLEVRLGRPIESQGLETSNKLSDFANAKMMLEECKDQTSLYFEQAVDACLDPFCEDYRQKMTLNDSVIRDSVYRRIVTPLERDFENGTSCSVGELDKLASTDSLTSRVISHSQGPLFYTKDRKTWAPKQAQPLVNELPSQSGERQICLYNDGERIGEVKQRCWQQADNWLAKFHKYVHPILPPMQVDDNHNVARSRFSRRPGSIRIGILDTGINFSEGIWALYANRIKGFKSWLTPNGANHNGDMNKEDHDLDGHGTHAAGLLLKVAEHAELYVAQVFKDRDESKNDTATEIHQRVANAIMYAANEWEVDVLSLSFGFKESAPAIQAAINFAESRDVIMIAAASNVGGNETRAWPARLDKVICVYASDGEGNPCSFNPTSQINSDNFSVLGDGVESCWPPHLRIGNVKGHQVRKSGTSTATPIAAGIAAIILEFVRRHLSNTAVVLSDSDINHFRKVWTTPGMKAIFRLMVHPRENFDYLVPWKLFDATPERFSRQTVYELMLDKLKTDV